MVRPRLVITDGNAGLAAALGRVWPGVAQQRCTVHKLRNLESKAPQHSHEALREDYHRIVYAEDRAAAERARERFLAKWRKPCAAVAASLEEADPFGRRIYKSSSSGTGDNRTRRFQPFNRYFLECRFLNSFWRLRD